MDMFEIGIFGVPFIVVFFIALTFYLDHLDNKKKENKKKKENMKSTNDLDCVKNNDETK